MLGAEACASTALNLLKSNIPQEQSTHDGGLSDVLQSFARSLGYTITNEPLSKEAKAQDVRGQIFFSPPTIYLQPTEDRVTLAETVAHELAHHYDYYVSAFEPLYFDSNDLQEQLAEAVAVALLLEYGVNWVDKGRRYIKSYRPSPIKTIRFSDNWPHPFTMFIEDFFDGGLDNAFNVVYSRFSRDFEEYLQRS